ncbi:hypothetical protein GOV04_01065 [Candidatus Woesearchaeota archaeon]|nr:hypothetical protein [Candidatus Woesearchaeota archaeon]
MARFDGPRERKSRSFRSDSSSKRDFREDSKGSSRNSRNRRDFEFTEVTCASCSTKCKVPFKPTSNKPVFCEDCFKKQDKSKPVRSSRESYNKPSERDLDIINEKLNKIMKALNIE